MEKHTTLSMLLSSLFAKNNLKNWTIYEDNSEFINVRIRFTKCEDSESVDNMSYRRVSEAQTRRNRERAARHRDAAETRRNTRSQTAHLTPEIPRGQDRLSDGSVLKNWPHGFAYFSRVCGKNTRK